MGRHSKIIQLEMFIKCKKCNEILPATTEYFHVSKSNVTGLHGSCKKCRKPKKNQSKENVNQYKTCKSCKRIYPMTSDFFYHNSSSKDGFRATCKECRKRYNKELKEKIKDKIKVYRKKHYYANKEQNRIYDANRRAIKKGNGGTYTLEQWEECLNFFENKCAYTGAKIEGKELHRDHIIPISKGGTSYIWNICPASKFANLSKRANDLEEWYKKQPYYDNKKLEKIIEWIDYAKDKYSV